MDSSKPKNGQASKLLSVAEYHQRWMCLQQVDVTGKKLHTFLYKGD